MSASANLVRAGILLCICSAFAIVIASILIRLCRSPGNMFPLSYIIFIVYCTASLPVYTVKVLPFKPETRGCIINTPNFRYYFF